MPLYGQSGYGLGHYGESLGLGVPLGLLPVSYYLSLLTSEYKLAPSLNANLEAKLQMYEDIQLCNFGIPEMFDLDFAVGVQLDTLGVIEGVSRMVGFQPSNGVSPDLDDDTYRILIKARIGWNQWDGTEGYLYPLWTALFPSGRIIILDNQNMTADIILVGAFTSILQDLIMNGYIVPRPQGVQYNYQFSKMPIFALDENNAYEAGLDTGYLS